MSKDPLISALLALCQDSDPEVRDAAFNHLNNMCEERFIKFHNYYRGWDPQLFDAILMITNIIEPNLDLAALRLLVEDYGTEILTEINDKKTIVENVEIFNHIFYRRLGFTQVPLKPLMGEDVLISTVLTSKIGNTITFPIAYFILARRCGLPIYPIIRNTTFIDGYIEEGGRLLFFTDLSDRGNIKANDTVNHYSEKMNELNNRDYVLLQLYTEQLAAYFRKMDMHIFSDYMNLVIRELNYKRVKK